MIGFCMDFGSTFVKSFVCEDEKLIWTQSIPFPSPCINCDERYEVPLSDIDRLLDDLLLRAAAYSPHSCMISVQMHGYVLRDSEGHFSNYISWRDRRGDVTLPAARRYDFTQNGTSLKANLPALKLLADCSAENGEFYTLGSYIAYRLTGNNATHITDALASGLFHARTLAPLPLPYSLTLPTVRRMLSPIGMYRGMKIYAPMGDHQISYFGSGAEESAYLLNIGTATQLCTLSREGVTAAGVEGRAFFNEGILHTVTGMIGGGTLFKGQGMSELLGQLDEALEKLPKRNKVLIGGGGAPLVFERLRDHLAQAGLESALLTHDIGTEGLHMLTKNVTPQIGTMLSEVCFPNFPIILKNSGLDFLLVDCEHGAFDYAPLSALMMNARLSELPVIIRLSDSSRAQITRLADMGASGFLLPMTNTAEDIRAVVDYAKYAPIGKRGISTNRAHTLYNPPPLTEYMEDANRRMRVYAQIETRAGVEHIDEILSTEGVDGVLIGPNDLSCDMGCIGDLAPIHNAIERVASAADRHGRTWGIITTTQALLDQCRLLRADMICCGSEINMLKDSCKRIKSKFA